MIDERELHELLAAMVRTPTVTGDEAAVAALGADWLRARGVDARLVEAAPGRPNVLAEHGPPTRRAEVTTAARVLELLATRVLQGVI